MALYVSSNPLYTQPFIFFQRATTSSSPFSHFWSISRASCMMGLAASASLASSPRAMPSAMSAFNALSKAT